MQNWFKLYSHSRGCVALQSPPLLNYLRSPLDILRQPSETCQEFKGEELCCDNIDAILPKCKQLSMEVMDGKKKIQKTKKKHKQGYNSISSPCKKVFTGTSRDIQQKSQQQYPLVSKKPIEDNFHVFIM